MKTANNILSIVLIIILAVSACIKLIHHDRTVSDMMMQVFPIYMAKYLAWGQPGIQLTFCMLLLSPTYNRIGMLACITYFSLLILYSATVLAKFYDYNPCSCIGLFRGLSWLQNLFLHTAALILSMFALFNQPTTMWLKSIFKKRERRFRKKIAN